MVVVGGGLIGCAIARELALEGSRVLLLERSRPGDGASGAAAGMLAPQAEARGPSPLLALGLASREMYREWVGEVARASGIDPDYREEGLIRVALGRDEAAELEGILAWQRREGLPVKPLERRELEARVSGLGPEASSGLFFPRDHQVDPRRLNRALAAAAAAAGVQVRAGTPVLGLDVRAGAVSGVRIDAGVVRADLTVVAAGCWTGLLAAGAEGLLPPTPPVRGQMLALEPDELPGRTPVMAGCGYLVPRSSGRLLVGATMEDAGYRCEVTGAGTADLLQAARRLVPSLAQARVVAAWAGLRPGSPDGLPSIGPGPAPGLLVATGHLRNGVLLAPITARLVADLVAGRPPRLDPAPFAPGRHLQPSLPPAG